MTTWIVTVDEAREHLVDLLAHIRNGDRVVISDDGKSVAQLVGPPMFPTTPEEVEATREQREAVVREWLARFEADPECPDGRTTQELLDEQRGRQG